MKYLDTLPVEIPNRITMSLSLWDSLLASGLDDLTSFYARFFLGLCPRTSDC